MANNGNCFETELISEDGTFNDDGKIAHFKKEVESVKSGVPYGVVSILGAQSSGKSTALNYVFGTDFKVMKAEHGRSKTTRGIWIAPCKDINRHTLVLDVEGTDGKERGQDGTTFEKQSALFALSVSDVVLVNMWHKDIGLENAGNRPLFRTLFQVIKKLYTHRKITLLFVVRDTDEETPFDVLEKQVRDNIKEIWKQVITDGTPLNFYFVVEVVALPHYKYEPENFKKEVGILRSRILCSISPGGRAGDPASGFICKSRKIWDEIKANKDLHLPSIQAMVANVRCEQIAEEKFGTFAAKEEWHQLEEGVKCGTVRGFVNKFKSLVDVCLSEYDAESMGYDERQRSKHQNQLQQKLLQLSDPAFRSALEVISSRVLKEFKASLDTALKKREGFSAAENCINSCMSDFDEECPDVEIKQADWNKNKVRVKLRRDIEEYIAVKRKKKEDVLMGIQIGLGVMKLTTALITFAATGIPIFFPT